MEFFGVGAGEAAMVLLITLLVVGPKRFPQIAREGGKYYRMARRYADAVMSDVRGAMDDLEQEVGEPGEGLRSIRELGRELNSGLTETTREVRRIGAQTESVAASTTVGLDAATPPATSIPDAPASAGASVPPKPEA